MMKLIISKWIVGQRRRGIFLNIKNYISSQHKQIALGLCNCRRAKSKFEGVRLDGWQFSASNDQDPWLFDVRTSTQERTRIGPLKMGDTTTKGK